MYLSNVFENYIPMFFTKKRINDKNDKNLQSNLTFDKLDQNARTKVWTLEVNNIHFKIQLLKITLLTSKGQMVSFEFQSRSHF